MGAGDATAGMRRERARTTLVAVVAVAAVTGCLAPVATDDSAGRAAPPLGGYAYACPPGPTRTLPNGLCVRPVDAWPDALEEPYLAVHPGNPAVRAIGTNTALAAGGLMEDPATAGRVDVFVTEDAGAAWRRAEPPPRLHVGDATATREGAADPALAFDDEGRLHLVQMNIRNGAGRAFDIQYARSDDLGRTWREPVLLSVDGDNDRPWVTTGPDGLVVVAWQNVWRAWNGSTVAFSRDGGAVWSTPLETPGNCISASRPLLVNGAVHVACSLHDGDEGKGRRFLRLDVDRGALDVLADAPAVGNGWSFWDALPDGRVALATRSGDHNRIAVTTRARDFTDWRVSEPLDALCECAGARRPLAPTWLATDPLGAVHVLLADGAPGFPSSPRVDNARYLAGTVEVWHVVLDPGLLTVVHERALTVPGPDPRERRDAPPLGATVGVDHVHGLVFAGGEGMAVWTRDRALDTVQVVAPPLDR